MLTPAFEITQDEEFLYIYIRCPMAKVSDTEIFIEKDDFKFYSKPYYLRLALPGNVVEDGRETAKYNADEGSLKVTVTKETKGEFFDGLDMISKMLAPRGQTTAKQPVIEVLESTSAETSLIKDGEDDDDGGDELIEEEEIDWQIEQEPYYEPKEFIEGYKYGFANQRCGVFSRLQDELREVMDVNNPDEMSPQTRREERLEEELDKFNEEYYLADLYQPECIEPWMTYTAPWEEEYKTWKSKKIPKVQLTEDEKEQMLKLPAKEYILNSHSQRTAFLSLVDIIMAYCYNHRTTEGENNVESGWTIRKLSSTLSWMESFTNVNEVVNGTMRRMLCFPLYRNWKLSKKVLKDTQQIFCIGQKRILKCLLEIHRILSHSDPYYVLNDLYITDYCVWIQSVSKKSIESLARSLCKVTVKINKKDVGLSLVELEEAASETIREQDAQESQNNTLVEDLSSLSLEPPQTSDEEDIISRLTNLNVTSENLIEEIKSKDSENCDKVTDKDTESGTSSSEDEYTTDSSDESCEDSGQCSDTVNDKRKCCEIVTEISSNSKETENEITVQNHCNKDETSLKF